MSFTFSTPKWSFKPTYSRHGSTQSQDNTRQDSGGDFEYVESPVGSGASKGSVSSPYPTGESPLSRPHASADANLHTPRSAESTQLTTPGVMSSPHRSETGQSESSGRANRQAKRPPPSGQVAPRVLSKIKNTIGFPSETITSTPRSQVHDVASGDHQLNQISSKSSKGNITSKLSLQTNLPQNHGGPLVTSPSSVHSNENFHTAHPDTASRRNSSLALESNHETAANESSVVDPDGDIKQPSHEVKVVVQKNSLAEVDDAVPQKGDPSGLWHEDRGNQDSSFIANKTQPHTQSALFSDELAPEPIIPTDSSSTPQRQSTDRRERQLPPRPTNQMGASSETPQLPQLRLASPEMDINVKQIPAGFSQHEDRSTISSSNEVPTGLNQPSSPAVNRDLDPGNSTDASETGSVFSGKPKKERNIFKMLQQKEKKSGSQRRRSKVTDSLSWLKGAKAKEVEDGEISEKDIIIAVMGPTGSGKSSFISKATNMEGLVGHDLKSCTSKISSIKLSVPELVDADIVFVDTPGFDDTNKPDTEILQMISDWLNKTYERKICLDGLLYFHRISDNRMAGTPLKNLRLFEKICGQFENVILTTTMWDEVDEDEGNQREKELKEIYWNSMIKRGSQVRRFFHTYDSAFEVLRPITERANAKHALLLQTEMTTLQKELGDTQAGKTLFLQLQSLVDRHQTMLERIRKELKEPELTTEQLKELMVEYQKVSTDLRKATEEMQTIATVTVGDRLKRATVSRNFLSFLSSLRNFMQFRSGSRQKKELPMTVAVP